MASQTTIDGVRQFWALYWDMFFGSSSLAVPLCSAVQQGCYCTICARKLIRDNSREQQHMMREHFIVKFVMFFMKIVTFGFFF